jgi:hypothetical protein
MIRDISLLSKNTFRIFTKCLFLFDLDYKIEKYFIDKLEGGDLIYLRDFSEVTDSVFVYTDELLTKRILISEPPSVLVSYEHISIKIDNISSIMLVDKTTKFIKILMTLNDGEYIFGWVYGDYFKTMIYKRDVEDLTDKVKRHLINRLGEWSNI